MSTDIQTRGGAASRWARWRELRRHGRATLAYHLLRRLLERSRLERWFDLQVHQVIAVPPWRLELPARLPHEMRVRELLLGDVPQLQRLRPANGRAYEQRLAAAHRGLGAFLGERLVAFVWLRRGPALLPASFGCVWQLTAPMAWIYDLYSDPGVLGAIPHLYAYLRQHPPGEQCQILVGQTAYDNSASRRAHARLGYRVRATLWSGRLGPWHLHLSHSRSAEAAPGRMAGQMTGRWRCHRRQALIPLHLFTTGMTVPQPVPDNPALDGVALDGSAKAAAGGVRLQCECGCGVSLQQEPLRCVCGRTLGKRRGGVTEIGPPIGYWGELPRPEMKAVLARAQQAGWRTAVEELVPEGLRAYVASASRAAFQDVLPLPPQARVLDVGAGWGGIATAMARRYQVVALEGVAERARFIALRAQQEKLERLTVIQGDLHRVPLGLHQFDLIIANGVLEWVALHDLNGSPAAVQLVFLHRLLDLLAPGGRIYIGIENRIGWAELRGALDHSGLPYTSLLPRFLARWVCARSLNYRSRFNVGYRTYTYSHRGYARLFDQVGLNIESTWIATSGYNHPVKLIPLQQVAIRFEAQARRPPAAGWRAQLRTHARHALAQEWIWRLIGSDFAFLLSPAVAAVTSPAAQPVLIRDAAQNA